MTKDGEPLDAVDFNFWGVTFAKDSNRFYATLRTDGHYYLVEGDLRERSMRVLRDRVECPSLSPDGTRIAYKSRIGNQNRWHLKVLDLDTLRAHSVGERRPIDDQVEWLNDEHPGLLGQPRRLHGLRRRGRGAAFGLEGRVVSGLPFDAVSLPGEWL